MEINFKKYIKFSKNSRRLFVWALVLTVLVWFVWFFMVGLKPINIIEQVAETKPLVSADPQAYKATENYLDKINSYQLPDFTKLYTNPEPFREYGSIAP